MDYSYEIRLRRGTDAQWSLKNPILSDGEPGYATDLNLYKIGNGIDRWTDLPWTTGLQGEAATVNVGDTITGEPGTGASVVNVGDENDAVLNFTIPEGLKGEPGVDGIDGKDSDLTYAVAEGRYERKSSLLATSTWHVNAKFLTADGSGLEDLTGNGRDAIFGAGDAAPIVLPHTGEDYVYFPVPVDNSNRINAIAATGTATTVTVTIKGQPQAQGSSADLFAVGSNHWGVYSTDATTYSIRRDTSNAAEQVPFTLPLDNTKQWHRFVDDGTLVKRYETSDDGVTWTLRATATHTGARTGGYTNRNANYGIGSGYVRTIQGPLYRFEVAWDGEAPTHIIDPANVNSTYTSIPNMGTAGGNWVITRAASGYKTAVVDRPLLLFGGGQYGRTAAPISPLSGEYTAIIAMRKDVGMAQLGGALTTARSNNTDRNGGFSILHGNQVATYPSPPGSSVVAEWTSSRITTEPVTVVVRPDSLTTYYDGQYYAQTVGTSLGTESAYPLTIGAWADGFTHAEMEFIGAAIFDRALTEEEIKQANLELLSVPHTEQPDPHPQYLPRTEAEQDYEKKLLSEAAWRIDAGALTPDGTGLADLSGNGRDAIFGDGAAAPKVLPHDGEDYIYFRGATNGNKVSHPDNREGSYTTVDIRAYADIDPTVTCNFINFAASTSWGAWLIRLRPGPEFHSWKFNRAGEAESVAFGVPQAGLQWHRWLLNGLTVTYQTSPDGETWTTHGVVGTHTGDRSGVDNDRLAEFGHVGYFGGSNGIEAKVYRLESYADGELTYVLDPTNVSDDYMTISNTGSVGGSWNISRATSGYKTTVVDRPLLLFGGGQSAIAENTKQLTNNPAWTLITGFRSFGDNTDGVQHVIIGNRQGSSSAGGNIPQATNTLALSAGLPHRTVNFGQAAGQHTAAIRADASGVTGFVDTASVSMGNALTQAPSAQNINIGKNPGASYWWRGEFIGAAIFDRALTDTEINQVAQELLGVPHEQRPDPHPQYLLRDEEVATWSALPPATHADCGKRIKVTGPGGWTVAHCIDDPNPRWEVAPDSDTGWRDVAGLLYPGWALRPTTGFFHIRRIGSTVFLRGDLDATGVTNNYLWQTLPSGWRGKDYTTYAGASQTSTSGPARYAPVTIFQSSNNLYFDDAAVSTATERLQFAISWVTDDPWPTTLPGTAV